MAEYIEREALRKLMYEEAFEKDSDMQRWDSGCWIRYKLFENCIKAIPAADVVERKKGEWIEDGYYSEPCVCSYCGEPCKDTVMGKPRWNFCPNCGADMRGET